MYCFYNVKRILYLVCHPVNTVPKPDSSAAEYHFIVPCKYNIPILQIIMCCLGREFEDFV